MLSNKFFYLFAIVLSVFVSNSYANSSDSLVRKHYDKYSGLTQLSMAIPFRTNEGVDLVMTLTKASNKKMQTDYFVSLDNKYTRSEIYLGDGAIFYYDKKMNKYKLQCAANGNYLSIKTPYDCGHYIHLSKHELNQLLNAKSFRYEIQGALYDYENTHGALREVTGQFGDYQLKLLHTFAKYV